MVSGRAFQDGRRPGRRCARPRSERPPPNPLALPSGRLSPLVPPDEAMCSRDAHNVAATQHRHLPVEVEEPQPGRLEATHHDGRKALHQRIAENWVGLQLGTETLGVDLYSAGAAIAPYAYSQKKPRLRRRSSRSSTRLQTCRFAYDQIGVL